MCHPEMKLMEIAAKEVERKWKAQAKGQPCRAAAMQKSVHAGNVVRKTQSKSYESEDDENENDAPKKVTLPTVSILFAEPCSHASRGG